VFTFTHHCSACDREQLVFDSMFTAVDRTPAGTEIHFTCWCGAPQTALRGAKRTERTLVAA
jgi:hypothetical protein